MREEVCASMFREGYDTPEYRAWRYAVFARDRWTCALCNSQGGELEAHHIKRWVDAPKLRYAASNGICLCKKCHDLVTGREQDFEEQFQRIVAMKKYQLQQEKGKPSQSNSVKKVSNGKFKWRPRNPRLRY